MDNDQGTFEVNCIHSETSNLEVKKYKKYPLKMSNKFV